MCLETFDMRKTLLAAIVALAVTGCSEPEPVRTVHQLSEAERERQQELLEPFMYGADIEGDAAARHSELLSLANTTVTKGDIEVYIFSIDAHEGAGEITVRVIDGQIDYTEAKIPEW